MGCLSMTNQTNRALGTLLGLAAGDAMGMPTQMLSRHRIAVLYPHLDRFEGGPPENPISAGQPAGRVTDDTEQALLIAHLLIAQGGHFDGQAFVRGLRDWAANSEADGMEQLGPSSRHALDLVGQGVPLEQAGRYGTTNGAAMRIAPVGVMTPIEPLESLIDRVVEVSQATHNTGIALAGASAVAAFISAAINGHDQYQALDYAVRAAKSGAQRGYYAPGPSIAARIDWAVTFSRMEQDGIFLDQLEQLVGLSMATEQAVPAAMALVMRWPEDPWRVICEAARLGGDSDTIGAMAGAMAGALTGTQNFPRGVLETMERVNRLALQDITTELLRLRYGKGD